MQTPRLSAQDIFQRLTETSAGQAGMPARPPEQALKPAHFPNYLAMYSSWWGGIVTDPALMLVPIDDHMVHRGDGVFEAMKVVNGGIYLLDEHLERLTISAGKIAMKLAWSLAEIKEIVLETCRAASERTAKQENLAPEKFAATLRLFVSRGPGSFGPSPYDTVGTQIYCIATRAAKVPDQKYTQGVSIGKSFIHLKPAWYPTVKSCNYLPNVLMKKESVDRKLDFTVNYTPEGFLAESATENIFILDRKGVLKHPSLEYILKGTMLTRLFDLVESSGHGVVLRGVDITESELLTAQGVFMAGTTMDVLPVTEYEGKKLPLAPEFKTFLKLLQIDQERGSQKLQICN